MLILNKEYFKEEVMQERHQELELWGKIKAEEMEEVLLLQKALQVDGVCHHLEQQCLSKIFFLQTLIC